MKITNQKELDKLITTAKDNWIVLEENLEITFNCNILCGIKARNIVAENIDARNIVAENIDAKNIIAKNIIAKNIDARDIKAGNIDVRDIKAGNIIAKNIVARYISYFAVCSAYQSFKCKSAEGRRENSRHFCLDGEIFFI